MAGDGGSARVEPNECLAEVGRLNRIIEALMNRAERATSIQGSDFTLFQTAIMLEDRVRSRTLELQAALRKNEATVRALRDSEARFRGVVTQSLIGIAIIEDGKFVYTNDKFDSIFGYDHDEISTRGPLDLAAAPDRDKVAEMIRRRTSGESAVVAYTFRGRRQDGSTIDVECYGSRLDHRTDGANKPVLISSVLDITERVRVEGELAAIQARLRDQATHDALTGLYNRRYLEESLSQELIRAERAGRSVSLIMADLDHFKATNDTYGHGAGDDVLREVGTLLRENARASDTYCRYGGEEFILLMPEVAEPDAIARAEQIRTTLESRVIHTGGARISVTASFGIAVFPQHGRDAEELIARADRAMYAAKRGGRNRACLAGCQEVSSEHGVELAHP